MNHSETIDAKKRRLLSEAEQKYDQELTARGLSLTPPEATYVNVTPAPTLREEWDAKSPSYRQGFMDSAWSKPGPSVPIIGPHTKEQMKRRERNESTATKRRQIFAELYEEERLKEKPLPSREEFIDTNMLAALEDVIANGGGEEEVKYTFRLTRVRWDVRYHCFTHLCNRQRNSDGLVECACCKQTSFNGEVFAPGDLECDHIQEVADGGSNSLDNLQLLCAICHRRKTRYCSKRRWHLSRTTSNFALPPCPGRDCHGCHRRDCKNPQPLSEYEIEQLSNIAKNNAELLRLGLLKHT